MDKGSLFYGMNFGGKGVYGKVWTCGKKGVYFMHWIWTKGKFILGFEVGEKGVYFMVWF